MIFEPRLLLALLSMLFPTTVRDAACYQDADKRVQIGIVRAGSTVALLEQGEMDLIYSPAHEQDCYLSARAFLPETYIHPDDLKNTMRWLTLIERWMPEFEDTLSPDIVLAVIMKETRGDPYAVDVTGLDVSLHGQASVGVMGAIPRTWLPCYDALVGENGKDDYGCQIYLGMTILHQSVQTAREKLGRDATDREVLRLALAAYNCGFDSVLEDKCYAWGGYVYSDKVLNDILPEIQAELAKSEEPSQ